MPKERLHVRVESASRERARRYSETHGTSISRLVEIFLGSLPLGTPRRDELPPSVRRLYGAVKGDVGIENYHEYLMEKYGSA
jgi:hypothetical protein